MTRTRVLVVDDHPLLRQGLRKVLELEGGFDVAGEAGSGEEALQMARRHQPRVILMDINLPGISGIEATRLIRGEMPDISILALTIHEDDQYVMEMMRAGASGYLLKDVDPGSLVEAINSAARGESYISPGVAGKVFGALSRMGQAQDGWNRELTPREREVLDLIAQGYGNQKIAGLLAISEKTVKNHVTSILRKLGVEDRTQAAVYALKHRLG